MKKREFTKCKKIDCQLQAAKSQAYCSRQHAPYAHLVDPTSGTLSATTGKSTTQDAGETLAGSSKVLREQSSQQLKTDKTPLNSNTLESVNASTLHAEENFIKHGEDPSGWTNPLKSGKKNLKEEWLQIRGPLRINENATRPIMINTEKNTLQQKRLGGEIETLPMALQQSLINIEAEKLTSMSLVDNLIMQLTEHMKSLKPISTGLKEESKYKIQAILAACACGNTIQTLIRLKLDIIKRI